MTADKQSDSFDVEMRKRFEEFSTWAVANWPNRKSPLASADFDSCRKEIDRLLQRDFDIGERNAAIPEPSENGPQYVSVNPAPWP